MIYAAVIHFSKSLAVEWKDFARVNTVSPGFFDTNMGASSDVLKVAYEMAVLGRQGDPRELKGVYLYLASDASSFTTGAGAFCPSGCAGSSCLLSTRLHCGWRLHVAIIEIVFYIVLYMLLS